MILWRFISDNIDEIGLKLEPLIDMVNIPRAAKKPKTFLKSIFVFLRKQYFSSQYWISLY